MDVVRLGLIGCGRIAERGYVPALERAAGLRLTAMADVEPSRCARAAPAVPAFASATALLEAGDVDAVVISTPAASHLELARLAAAAGVRALVEKPPGVDGTEAAELAALDPAPAIGFNRRFDADLEQLREWTRSAGRLELSLSIGYRRSLWRPHDVDDDALLDLGPHLVDLARGLAGDVIRVRALRVSERRAQVELDLERGQAQLSGATDRAYREVFALQADGLPAVRHEYGGLAAALRTRLGSRHADPFVVSLAAQLEAFANVVRGGRWERLATAADGLAAMLVVDAARASARAGDRSWRAIAPVAVT